MIGREQPGVEAGGLAQAGGGNAGEAVGGLAENERSAHRRAMQRRSGEAGEEQAEDQARAVRPAPGGQHGDVFGHPGRRSRILGWSLGCGHCNGGDAVTRH